MLSLLGKTEERKPTVLDKSSKSPSKSKMSTQRADKQRIANQVKSPNDWLRQVFNKKADLNLNTESLFSDSVKAGLKHVKSTRELEKQSVDAQWIFESDKTTKKQGSFKSQTTVGKRMSNG